MNGGRTRGTVGALWALACVDFAAWLIACVSLLLPACQFLNAQQPPETSGAEEQLLVQHAQCEFFGDKRNQFVAEALNAAGVHPSRQGYSRSVMTDQVTQAIGPLPAFVPGGSRTHTFEQVHQPASIDSYIFADMQAAGVKPADRTTDFEFIRRVTLDLTGRIPTADRVLSFVADTNPAKRAALVDELMKKPEWVDKWTMYFGDLYKNNAANTQIVRYAEGRNAFYKWTHDSLAANKPYDRMAREMISTQGTNSFYPDQGAINWMVGGVVTGGPTQDIFDQQAANVAETFLGVSHMNCLLCHNGRGHLDALSLWGKNTTRYQAWQFSSFLSHTWTKRDPIIDPATNMPVQNYSTWSVQDDSAPAYRINYQLNTTTGNRPARQPTGTDKTIAPVYLFNGDTPAPGENYREALARDITSDIQFARAAVNYIWAEFFGRGIVDPPNQFDPARLDPDNPPPDPWTIQPSNPHLLDALAQKFAAGGFDLKSLMRDITTSDTYQLSARYNGQWDPSWEKYFARKFVRRLWSEEVHDAVAQSSGIMPSYTIGGFTNPSTIGGGNYPGFGKITWAMQFPDTIRTPDGGGAVSQFLDSFLRGNRDDELRRTDGSILQALDLMNDNFIESRIHATGAAVASSGLLAKNLNLPDDQLVNLLFLNVLSRYPTDAEKATALSALGKAANRTQTAENLFWSLYNKVDFVFNY